ncbi:MAG: hypothetical protein H6978_16155 [Gammaproteobacteria bacterium]|nr:hypothetical protein [Gammaproteobacteria bacterium]
MRINRYLLSSLPATAAALVAALAAAQNGFAEVMVDGAALDLGGTPLAATQISLQPGIAGPSTITIFTGDDGHYLLPGTIAGRAAADINIRAVKLGYEHVDTLRSITDTGDGNQRLTLTAVMRRSANQAGVAPASAWLKDLSLADQAQVVMACVGCHQLPAPEVRRYANLIADLPGDAAANRAAAWPMIVNYMNFLSAEEFSRGNPHNPSPEPDRVYSGGQAEVNGALLARTLTGRMDYVAGYDYGAPLAVNEHTVIREFEVARPNAIREAVMMGTPPRLWAADVSSNRIVSIDVATGVTTDFEVPTELAMGPHTLVPGENALWVAAFFNGYIARLDIPTGKWQTWQLHTNSGGEAGVHDLTFGPEHQLLADYRGRIWYSDIVNNAVGFFDPASGEMGTYPIPEIEGRPGSGASVYGIVMTSDRKHIWFSQLGIASFGSFNTETLKFEQREVLDNLKAGPRRLAITEDDILYVPLYGAGQLIAYDTKARRTIAVHDLPDRASAPYAVTWDPLRKVVWIPTSNANAIYRFDPATKDFSVLPLPREGAFLRMLQVHPQTGLLVTSYANIVETVHGPRMALIIDPGDQDVLAGTMPTRHTAINGN